MLRVLYWTLEFNLRVCLISTTKKSTNQEIIEIPDVHTILAGIEEYRNVLDLPPYWSVKKFLENRPTSEDIEALVNQQYHIGYMKLHVLIEEFLQKFIQ